jgi:hypothetical protein
MSAAPNSPLPRGWLRVALRDAHFWIPVAVLLAGLLVLRWVAGN